MKFKLLLVLLSSGINQETVCSDDPEQKSKPDKKMSYQEMNEELIRRNRAKILETRADVFSLWENISKERKLEAEKSKSPDNKCVIM